jgi:hypothetical protein
MWYNAMGFTVSARALLRNPDGLWPNGMDIEQEASS